MGMVEALDAALAQHLAAIQHAATSRRAAPAELALQHRIATLVPAVDAAPAGPSLGSIFANAQKTSKEVPWAGQVYRSVMSLNCVHCGGPQEQPQDFMCKYCRRPIAGNREEEKKR
jgi:hypothetical protein